MKRLLLRQRASSSFGSREAVGVEASRHSTRFESKSSFYCPERESRVRRMTEEDFIRGKLVGKGAFNDVYEVSLIGNIEDEEVEEVELFTDDNHVVGDAQDEQAHDAGQLPQEFGEVELQSNAGRCMPKQYVVKSIQKCFLDDFDKFKNGTVDLVVEAKMLASMTRHRNVIRLYGMAEGSISQSVAQGKFFIILERVECTLADRLVEWRMAKKGGIKGLFSRSGSASQRSITLGSDACQGDEQQEKSLDDEVRDQRYRIASGMVQGLRHIHSHNILFRDIKPQNIGIDYHGSTKILDFGFAKEVFPDQNAKRPTGMVGTLRYMSPEVALCKFYDGRCDVYSFGIVLWELFALEKPFKKMNRRQVQENVICGGERPKISTCWPGTIQDVMRQCWAQEPKNRPSLEAVATAIGNARRRQKRKKKKSGQLVDFLSSSLHSVASLRA